MGASILTVDEIRQVEVDFPDAVPADQPVFIFAHGAGNDMSSPFIVTISQHLQERGISVIRFNFPYKVQGKKMPDRAEVLENSWRRVIEWVTARFDFDGLFIGGKSMGGRVAATIAGEFAAVDGVIFLGYPLHPAGKFDSQRDEYLLPLEKPMLFVQGTRDPLARMDLLQDTLNHIRDRATLHWVEGGDHSFRVLVRQGISYPEVLQQVANRVADWIAEVKTGDEKRP